MKATHLWKLVIGWALVIFVLSSIPGRSFPSYQIFSYDKVLHALVYAVLGALCFLALRRSRPWSRAQGVAVAAALAIAYGLSDEFHQLFVAGRSADLHDVLADGIGGFLGAAIASGVPQRERDAPSS